MKNITVKIDDDTYRKARIQAAGRGTSVSAMVRDFLIRETTADNREDRRIAALEELFKQTEQRGKTRAIPLQPLTREEMYAERLR